MGTAGFYIVDNITNISQHPTTIPGYDLKTRVAIGNISLWYLGTLSDYFKVNDRVSTFYEEIMVHGYRQRWIHFIYNLEQRAAIDN